MEKGSAEHEAYKAAYNAERDRRRADPKEYPYFIYCAFGWHRMDYISEDEKDDAISFYKGMVEFTDGSGHKGWQRYGRQPITITWAGERKVER